LFQPNSNVNGRRSSGCSWP